VDERRRKSRRSSLGPGEISFAIDRADGARDVRTVALTDSTEWGVGFETPAPMVVGATVSLWGPALAGAPDESRQRRARVMHCRLTADGRYRAGCAFEDTPPVDRTATPLRGDLSLSDHYETLQVSPSADPETIHRVYRHLAQRYHPDNPDTGAPLAFQAVLQAYQTLSDPQRRAAYDVQYQASKALRWRVFDKPENAEGVEAEKRLRAGVLMALYARRRKAPESPGMMVREIEDLLGVPREHLEFAFWYLRRRALVEGPQNGRYELAVEGVDAAEELYAQGYAPKPVAEDHLLPSAERRKAEAPAA
jgi:hypothetical protein